MSLALGAPSSSPGTVLLSFPYLWRQHFETAEIDVWEWGMAQIISVPLSSHSSAIPEASTPPQQQIPLEGSSYQLS